MSVMEPTQQRSRGFSFKSDKSHSSRTSKSKVDLKETAEEKRRTHLAPGTKSNPNSAMNEAQPSTFDSDPLLKKTQWLTCFKLPKRSSSRRWHPFARCSIQTLTATPSVCCLTPDTRSRTNHADNAPQPNLTCRTRRDHDGNGLWIQSDLSSVQLTEDTSVGHR